MQFSLWEFMKRWFDRLTTNENRLAANGVDFAPFTPIGSTGFLPLLSREWRFDNRRVLRGIGADCKDDRLALSLHERLTSPGDGCAILWRVRRHASLCYNHRRNAKI